MLKIVQPLFAILLFVYETGSNKPSSRDTQDRRFIHPNISDLENKYNTSSHFIDLKNLQKYNYLFQRDKCNVFCTDLEGYESERGKHSKKKIQQILGFLLPHYSEKFEYFNKELVSGAIIFDVDETVLINKVEKGQKGKYEQTLLESPMRFLIIELLEKGFQLCAITGNDSVKFKKRFLEPLYAGLSNIGKTHLLSNLEIYFNGAANRMYFERDGSEKDDAGYNKKYSLPKEHINQIDSILKSIVNEVQNMNSFSNPEIFQSNYDLSKWKYDFNPSTKKWYEGSTMIPYIEIRANDSMLTLKPLPSEVHLKNKNTESIRDYVVERVQSEFVKAFGRGHSYSINSGGSSSIDITIKGISKAKAVENYLEVHKLNAEEVIYFGNEFKVGGNDQSVVDQIKNITVISVNQEKDDTFFTSNIIYGGGRGVYSTMHHFGDILEIYKDSEEKLYYKKYKSKPIIQQKIESLYSKEIEERWSQIRLYTENPLLTLIKIQRKIVKEQNKTLEELTKKICLMIPAVGKENCLNSNIPKPLYKINSKEAILHVLDNFSEFAKEIIIIIQPEQRKEFEKVLSGREELITLVEHADALGEGKAILDNLKYIKDKNCNVLIAWADLILASKEKIKETIDAHLRYEAVMTFPTMIEKNPYVTIKRNRENNFVNGVDFSQYGETNEFGEHDCSFFLLKYDELKEALRSLQSTYYDSNQSKYQFRNVPGEFKFLHIIEEFARESKKVIALSIASPEEFIGFNTIEEADKIERILSER